MISRRAAGSLIALLVATLATGCVTPPKKDYTAFRAADPRSILVIPVVNNTINIDAPGLFLSTLPIPIAERGYYVFPVNMVRGVLESEGLSDPNLVHGADVARLCNLFGADAVLYVSIEAWTAKYIVFNTEVSVEFDYVMKDGKTGETIWREHHKVVRNSSDGARDPLSPLVMAVIAKAYPNYMPLARDANSRVFTAPGVGLPAGPRHKEYGNATDSGK
jgi:hypothetical protein